MVAKDLLFPLFEFDFNWLEDVNNLFYVNRLEKFCNIIANQSALVINLTLQAQFIQGVINRDVDFLIYVCQFILGCLELFLMLSTFFLLLIPGYSKFPCLFPSLHCLHCVVCKPVKLK